MDQPDLVLELPAHPSVVGEARRAASRLPLRAEALESLELVISELVTNAIRHSGTGPLGSIVLRVSLHERAVEVEVADGGHGFPAPHPPQPRGISGGFGLMVVDRLAERWGVATDGGTRVWARLPR